MSKLIVDEKEKALGILKNGFVNGVSYNELCLLAQYFRSEGQSFRKVEESLISFCEEKDKFFNKELFRKKIRNAINYAKRYKLKENVAYVLVNSSELEKLKVLPYKLQKLVFVMLVFAKRDKFVDNRVKPSSKPVSHGYYYNHPFEDAVRMAKIKMSKNDIFDAKYKLDGELGYVSFVEQYEEAWRVCIATDDGEPVVVVDDFSDVIKFIPPYCEKCGKIIVEKSRHHDMCEECYKEKRAKDLREKNRNAIRTKRSKNV